MFADDTACLASNQNTNELFDYANQELTKIARWFRANKMAVNVGKTKFIIFHTKGTKINSDSARLFYNDNEPNTNDPNLITELDRIQNSNEKAEYRTYKLLGVNFDENLTFNTHFNYLANKISRSLYCISRTKNFVNKKSLVTLYYALVHSHLNYCPLTLSSSSQSNIKRILTLQKKAIRIVTRSNYNAHTGPLFKELAILPYDKLITEAKYKFMHSYVFNTCPTSFSNTWPLNRERIGIPNLRNEDLFEVPHPRIEMFKQSPLYTLPVIWNELNECKYYENRTTFKIAIRELLMDNIDE